ncbi:TlpA disulfide reductase family protein [Klugiella xanthotipulae]|uniref:Thiol-disulfide isomerase/thioredoxin n=1 Tax=Klugiella xanthotipulae TaxID=244735 RepID=A0A543HZ67_9MICO|nr:TlpA disulfide reductase family protein [Klugiella xanthotipulae]TQM63646.1 thiol-disulfide isomerase/thioredoxin [Klugiella xanthotipulae]
MNRTSRGLRSAAVIAVMTAVSLSLAGCGAGDSLAQQWNSGGDTGYIGGDGTITEIPEAQRGEPVVFAGTDEKGAAVSSEDFAGSVTVVNFWYAGCAPCRVEAPDLETVHTTFADQGVIFLGVNTRDQSDQAVQFADEFGVTYPSIMDTADNRSVQRAFAGSIPLNAVPTTLVLDTEGRVAVRILGQLQDASILTTLVSDTLAEK